MKGNSTTVDPNPFSCAPFIVLMLVMAFTPLTRVATVWESLRVKMIVVACFSIPIWIYYGAVFGQAGADAMVTQLVDWINFVCLIGPLYVVAGGVYFDYDGVANPIFNTAFLLFGAVLANITGTTGACMILIRVFIHRNKPRLGHHHICFFIFLIGNVGGLLTPLGDPPMFIGFLKGIPFLWMLSTPAIIGSWIFCVGLLLVMFFFWDSRNYKEYTKRIAVVRAPQDETVPAGAIAGALEDTPGKKTQHHLIFKGWKSLCGFVVIVLIVIIQGLPIYGVGTERTVQLVASAFQVTCAVSLHYFIEDKEIFVLNQFSFTPMLEVVILFFGLFMTLAPVLGYLEYHASELGIDQPWKFLWVTGALSAILDNAPTYLTFAGLAAGQFNSTSFNDPTAVSSLLATSPDFAKRMAGISIGAVFFGAVTYLGNAPNLMVKGTVEALMKGQDGYPVNAVPNFLVYMAWAIPTLIPLFIAVTFIVEA